MHITDRLHSKKWGVFHHYLYNIQNDPQFSNNQNAGQTDWQSCTEELNIPLLAKTLHEIGATWAGGGLHNSKEELCDFAEKVISAGGVVSFDCKLNRDGSLDDEQVEALRYIGSRINSAT